MHTSDVFDTSRSIKAARAAMFGVQRVAERYAAGEPTMFMIGI